MATTHPCQPTLSFAQRGQGWVLNALVTVCVAIGLWLRIQGAFVGGEAADVVSYRGHVEVVMRGLNVYQARQIREYPYLPGWLVIEVTTFRVGEALKVPFWQAIRMVIVIADVLVCFALWWAAARGGNVTRGRWAAVIYALSPIAVIIAGYHGQFDTLPTLLAILAAGFLLATPRPLAAGLLLGAAIAIKPFPLLLAPALLRTPGLTRRDQIAVGLAMLGVILLVAAPFLIADAGALLGDIGGYSGVNDQGLSGILRSLWLARADNLDLPGEFGPQLMATTKYLALAAIAFVYLIMVDRPVASVASAVLLTLLGLYGGISTQYLSWPLAWLLVSEVALLWPVVYSVGTAAGAIGFYMVFWPQLLYGPGARAPQPELVAFYIGGQVVSWLTIWATLLAVVVRSLLTAWWRRPLPTLAFGLTTVSAGAVISQVTWLAGEWMKIGR
jgi:hypothetical protein